MLNDKFIIEMSCNYIYRLDELKNASSNLFKYLINNYPNFKIIDFQTPFNKTRLHAICIQDTLSKDVAIIYQGSTDLEDWRHDNLNNFLNKNVQQYEAALEYYEYIENKGHRITYVGGNSLGGGCAQYVGLKHPHTRAICINSSPLTKHNDNDSKNILNIRVSSEPLYRCVSLDSDRYESGYVGTIVLVNRSLYGSYNYFNNLELAHRGAIVFPYNYIYTNYHVNSMEEFKNVVDAKTYNQFMQLKIAPSLSQFMSFDLITNNINQVDNFDLTTLNKNYNIRLKEIKRSLLDYTIPNFELKIGAPFIHINNEISDNLKMIIKYSLLHITKQEEKLYDNIYYVIEKSTNYFYKIITENLMDINNNINGDTTASDYEKTINDMNINKLCITNILKSLSEISNELNTYNNFSFKDFLNKKTIEPFNQQVKPFTLDYKEFVYDKIDKSIINNISSNKSFIEQLEKMIVAALKAKKISLQLTQSFIKSSLVPEDIDYLMKYYNIGSIIENALSIFKNDFYEAILANSMLQNYQSNLTNINEQLFELRKTTNNLKEYLSLTKNNHKQKRIIKKIDDINKYIDELIKFNKQSLIN
ncbi:hypothetical protein OKW23_000689 [Bacilli bacterium PM5-9]|nr:hypothetical protein [Bacilli bacterium PM5-9]